MTRATFRAFKCRQGVHRLSLAGQCRDCGATWFKLRPSRCLNWSAVAAANVAALFEHGVPSRADALYGMPREWLQPS